jgi:hypothetical protein
MRIMTLVMTALVIALLATAEPVFAADIRGQVLGAGKPIASST